MAPIFACTSQAPLGKQESGDEVAKRIRSISSGAIPACSMALAAAFAAISDVLSSVAIRLSPMPVRLRIHSSFVSTIFDRSSFVTICSGTYEPVPIILVVIFIYPAPNERFK